MSRLLSPKNHEKAALIHPKQWYLVVALLLIACVTRISIGSSHLAEEGIGKKRVLRSMRWRLHHVIDPTLRAHTHVTLTISFPKTTVVDHYTGSRPQATDGRLREAFFAGCR